MLPKSLVEHLSLDNRITEHNSDRIQHVDDMICGYISIKLLKFLSNWFFSHSSQQVIETWKPDYLMNDDVSIWNIFLSTNTINY